MPEKKYRYRLDRLYLASAPEVVHGQHVLYNKAGVASSWTNPLCDMTLVPGEVRFLKTDRPVSCVACLAAGQQRPAYWSWVDVDVEGDDA